LPLPDKPILTIPALLREAAKFSHAESSHDEPALFGITDGKAVGTYLEHKFVAHLMDKYTSTSGNSAKGIDLPGVNVDIKVTSVKQPQSSCPFKTARQKIFGLGYSLIVFVYEKTDDKANETSRLKMHNTIFIDQSRTADFQMTRGLREIISRDGNAGDLVAYMQDKNLPVDEVDAYNIAEILLKKPPEMGYLTISNALQWRLQYQRVIECAGSVEGITRVS
jgi:hypothetical protein